MWDGIILAHNKVDGEKLRITLHLRDWYVATPNTLLDGRTRSVRCKPLVLAFDNPQHDPVSHTILQFSRYLVDMCGGVSPEVFHVRKAGS